MYKDKRICFGCGACVAVCPAGVISMELDEEGFPYPCMKTSHCLKCGRCEAVCPAKVKLERQEGNFYAVRCKDKQLLLNSTYGGAFSLLAQDIIMQNGLVCGAVFDHDFSVRHILSQDFKVMQKSKYIQSDMSGCFADIKKALEGGRLVLFSGTPCQCHALKCFISDNHERLFLASLVCRGVQPPGFWKDYTAWLSHGGTLQAYDFRDKRYANDGHAVAYMIDGRETTIPMQEDKLSRMYNRSITYRPSCYQCPYSRADNGFDFTLGDFWGIEQVYPPFADGQGTSLVIVRGKRGEKLFSQIREKAQVLPCKKNYAMQPALAGPAKEHLLRKFFFRDYAQKTEEGICDISFILQKYSRGQ